ncbi:MAG: bacterial transcriptional activator domain-containing protein [Planctomycetota bacterium]|nr:bacterial transcriptional activator domain-containing protein [Planctomycetota bacterium]
MLSQLLFAAVAALGAGDVLCLKDGRVVDGVPMERKDGGIALAYQNGTVFVADELIQDAVLEADAARAPADAAEAEQRKNGMVTFEGRWIPEKKRAELVAKRLAERRARAEEAKARLEWRNRAIVETKNLRFEHQLPDHVFAEYRDSLEAFLATFSRNWKLETPKDRAKLPVNIYIDRRNFFQVAGVSGGVLAYFRFKKPYDLNGYHDRLDPDYAKQVLYHEFVHYLEKLVDIDFAYPHFPNESVAEYYGASRWDPVARKFTTGLLQEGRLWEIQTDIAGGERMSLERLISSDRLYEHYTWGWSLVHYLMNDVKLEPKFESFFLALSKGKAVRRTAIGFDNLQTCSADEVWRVFRQEFGLKDAEAVRKFEVAWHEYVDGLIARNTSVAGKEKAGYQALETGRPLRAKRFFQEAIDAGSRSPRVFLEQAGLLLADGKAAAGLALIDRAIALDPLNGAFHGRKGRALKATGDKAEGERLVKLGREIGGDDPWIEIDLTDGDDDGTK